MSTSQGKERTAENMRSLLSVWNSVSNRYCAYAWMLTPTAGQRLEFWSKIWILDSSTVNMTMSESVPRVKETYSQVLPMPSGGINPPPPSGQIFDGDMSRGTSRGGRWLELVPSGTSPKKIKGRKFGTVRCTTARGVQRWSTAVSGIHGEGAGNCERWNLIPRSRTSVSLPDLKVRIGGGRPPWPKTACVIVCGERWRTAELTDAISRHAAVELKNKQRKTQVVLDTISRRDFWNQIPLSSVIQGWSKTLGEVEQARARAATATVRHSARGGGHRARANNELKVKFRRAAGRTLMAWQCTTRRQWARPATATKKTWSLIVLVNGRDRHWKVVAGRMELRE
ncbi:hypothetical protein C8R47DRAFT_1080317 [Mycena vitilis]|nr:hypothetical protein C8R47DRAFT_1080317 [Mycena vitilis]